MTDADRRLLEREDWTVECESPFEIRHQDGSFATERAAVTVLMVLQESREEEKQPKVGGFRQYLSILMKIEELEDQGKGDSSEEENLVEQLEKPWYEMTVEEQTVIRKVSSLLNKIRTDRKPK